MLRASSLQLLAIVPVDQAPQAMTALNDLDQQRRGEGEAKAVAIGDIAALLLPARKRMWKSRKHVGRELVSFQEGLEVVHASGSCLPAAPGAVFDGGLEAARFLTANAPVLIDGLKRFKGVEQHQIVIELPGAALLKRLSDAPEVAEARRLVQNGERVAAGRLLQQVAEAARGRLRSEWFAQLSALGADAAELPQPTVDAVVNMVLLGKRGGGAAIEKALEEIDAGYDGGLKIRLIGPAPASSFASVVVERPAKETVREAASRLGVPETADFATVKDAHHKAMKRLHPDVAGPSAAPAARAAQEAYELLARIAASNDALRSAGDASRGAPVLARLHREGDQRSDIAQAAA